MDEKFQELEEMQRELMEENEALKEFVRLCHTRKEHVNKLRMSQEERQVNKFISLFITQNRSKKRKKEKKPEKI